MFNQDELTSIKQQYDAMRASQPQHAAPAAHGPGGLKGFLIHLLPTIGSIGGMALGTLAAPGVGTAAGGAGGAVLGQKLEDKLTGNHTGLSGYLGQAALGSLGGIGKGIKAVGAGVDALRAGEGAGAAGNAIRFGAEGSNAVKGMEGLTAADKVVVANEANAGQAGVRDLVAGKAVKAGQSALLSQTGGLSRQTAANAIRDVPKIQDLGYNSVEKMATHAPAVTGPEGALTQARTTMLQQANPIDATGFKQLVDEHVGNNVDLTPAQSKNINSLMDKLAAKYKFAGEGGEYGHTPALNVEQGRRDIMTAAYKAPPNSATRNTLLDVGNAMRDPLEQSLSHVALDDGTKQALITSLQSKGVSNPKLFTAIKNAQTASDLSAIESPYVTASQMTKEGAEFAVRAGAKTFDQSSKKLTGMANEALGTVVGKPLKRLSAGLTNKVANLTKPGEVPAPATLPGVAASAAKGGVKAQVVPRFLTGDFAGATPPAADQQPVATDAPAGDAGAAGATPLTPDLSQPDQTDQLKNGLMAAMVSDLQNGGKNVASLSTIYKLITANQTDAKTKQAQQDIQGAINQIQTYSNILNSGAVGGAKGGILGRIEVGLGKAKLGPYANVDAINSQRKEVGATIAKALTGNSRPAQNMIDAWANALPGADDPPASAKAKVDYILQLIQAKQSAMGSDSSSSGPSMDQLVSALGGAQA